MHVPEAILKNTHRLPELEAPLMVKGRELSETEDSPYLFEALTLTMYVAPSTSPLSLPEKERETELTHSPGPQHSDLVTSLGELPMSSTLRIWGEGVHVHTSLE